MIDFSLLLDSVDGDRDLLRSLCELFLESYPKTLLNIRIGISRADYASIARAAHTLKGSGAYFLTEAARQTLLDLEQAAQRQSIDLAEQLFAKVESEMEALKKELTAFVALEK